jgi:alpha-ribazole phosphatase
VNKLVETTIDLLRHGECEGGHIYRGSIDVDLTSQGWQQMTQSLQLLLTNTAPDWETIICSPMKRCQAFARDTAERYQSTLTLAPALKEISFGEWEGQRVDDIWQHYRKQVEAWGRDPANHPPPGGEAADAFFERVLGGLNDIIRENQGQRILLVIHGGVIRALLTHILSMPLTALNRLEVPYACLSRIVITHSDNTHYYRLVYHNLNHGA